MFWTYNDAAFAEDRRQTGALLSGKPMTLNSARESDVESRRQVTPIQSARIHRRPAPHFPGGPRLHPPPRRGEACGGRAPRDTGIDPH